MRLLPFVLAAGLLPAAATAQCGGGFQNFVKLMKDEAVQAGFDTATVHAFFSGTRQDAAVLKADRAQSVFQKPFIEFTRHLISQSRIKRGRQMAQKHDATFQRIENTYGIDRGVLLAFWAFETDYGGNQGDFNTRDALVTLAHDCRRPELFRPQVFSALELFSQGNFDPKRTTGAWAGEIGMVQMLPGDILKYGVDADGDGQVSLKTSAADALMSGARMLSHLGWQPGQPWLQEVSIPEDLDLTLTGTARKKSIAQWRSLGVSARDGKLPDPSLRASLLLPQGHKGPAFLAYPNFEVYFKWNQSFTYVLTAAYFANRLEGAEVYSAGQPENGLSGTQMKQLQHKLQARGHNVGDIDGILGARTRVAVQKEQARLGLPADAWPTPVLLQKL
ncbi:lytic murein transglycosylase [Leisingera sp.]|uniref:lytic murein transglycosylase n=1 Tax=Leisingera sp. TaxID=1879318 RepID=UPI002B27775F|nr:lytic murein transglycosylase [Leisingera sp.]